MRASLAFALLLAVASPAYANHCPADMAKIDAALLVAQLGDADLAKVKELRAEGETLHNEGKHDESVAKLAEAMAILGI
jgi:hypothetical protein